MCLRQRQRGKAVECQPLETFQSTEGCFSAFALYQEQLFLEDSLSSKMKNTHLNLLKQTELSSEFYSGEGRHVATEGPNQNLTLLNVLVPFSAPGFIFLLESAFLLKNEVIIFRSILLIFIFTT